TQPDSFELYARHQLDIEAFLRRTGLAVAAAQGNRPVDIDERTLRLAQPAAIAQHRIVGIDIGQQPLIVGARSVAAPEVGLGQRRRGEAKGAERHRARPSHCLPPPQGQGLLRQTENGPQQHARARRDPSILWLMNACGLAQSKLIGSTLSTAPSCPTIRTRCPAGRSGPDTRQTLSPSTTRPNPCAMACSSTASCPTYWSARSLRCGRSVGSGRLRLQRTHSVILTSDSTPKISHCSGQPIGWNSTISPVITPEMPIHSRNPPGNTSSSASRTSPPTIQAQGPARPINSITCIWPCPRYDCPAEGGRPGRAGAAPLPKVSRAISAMPPIEPMTLAASTGSISTFWLGEVAILPSASI